MVAVSAVSRSSRARSLSWATRSLVGASRMESRPAAGVGRPGLVGHVGGGALGADMDPLVVDVEADRGRVTGAQREAGGGFGLPGFGVGEAHHGAQGDGVAGLGEIAQHTAGREGGQLLVIADEAHAGTARHGVGDEGVEVQCGGHTGLVEMISVPGPIVSNHLRAGSSAGAGGPPRVAVSWTSLARCRWGNRDLGGKDFGGAGGRRQPDYGAAARCARPPPAWPSRWSSRSRRVRARAARAPRRWPSSLHQRFLAVVEVDTAVGVLFEHRQTDAGFGRRRAPRAALAEARIRRSAARMSALV